MKDAVHHLKHIQRKVIQSTRKANALEANLNGEALSKPSGGPSKSLRQKTADNQVRRSLMRQ